MVIRDNAFPSLSQMQRGVADSDLRREILFGIKRKGFNLVLVRVMST